MKFPSKRQFTSWLQQKPDGSVVGEACSNGRCPLARYLEEHGAPAPYVRPDAAALNSCWRPSADGVVRRHLPQWANEFAKEIDFNRHGGVSKGVCLNIISRL